MGTSAYSIDDAIEDYEDIINSLWASYCKSLAGVYLSLRAHSHREGTQALGQDFFDKIVAIHKKHHLELVAKLPDVDYTAGRAMCRKLCEELTHAMQEDHVKFANRLTQLIVLKLDLCLVPLLENIYDAFAGLCVHLRGYKVEGGPDDFKHSSLHAWGALEDLLSGVRGTDLSKSGRQRAEREARTFLRLIAEDMEEDVAYANTLASAVLYQADNLLKKIRGDE